MSRNSIVVQILIAASMLVMLPLGSASAKQPQASLATQTPAGELAPRVLVVFNGNLPDSKAVAEHYMHARSIPAANLCRIVPSAKASRYGAHQIPWENFDKGVRDPIRQCLQRIGKDKILYIVFSYGTPYGFADAPPGITMSIDESIADIWDETGPGDRTKNPYFGNPDSAHNRYTPFESLADFRNHPGRPTIYSVWRLDGANPDLADGLVDHALEAERHGAAGTVCIDRRYANIASVKDAGAGAGDWELFRIVGMFLDHGLRVVEDNHEAEFGTPPAPPRCDHAIFYAGWYSLNHYNDVFTWNPGAIGIHLDSASAQDPRGGTNWAANAIKRGITVTSGAMAEPYLEGLPHVDGFVHDLFAGGNVGDAMLRNTAWLKWTILNIGDPLYRPRFMRAGR